MRKPKITPSIIISILALVVALGGTSYAAVKINGKNIASKSIGQGKIKKNAIGSNRIKDGRVKAKDLAAGVIPTVKNARWLLVNPDGTIKAQSGGFTLVANYPVLANTAVAPAPDNSLRANGNVYINAGDDLSDNGITASVVLQNTVDQDGGGMAGRTAGADANAEFSGEISVSRCNVAGATGPANPTNCAPAGAQNATSFVVSPRLSDGQVTTDANRKAFYVIVTG